MLGAVGAGLAAHMCRAVVSVDSREPTLKIFTGSQATISKPLYPNQKAVAAHNPPPTSSSSSPSSLLLRTDPHIPAGSVRTGDGCSCKLAAQAEEREVASREICSKETSDCAGGDGEAAAWWGEKLNKTLGHSLCLGQVEGIVMWRAKGMAKHKFSGFKAQLYVCLLEKLRNASQSPWMNVVTTGSWWGTQNESLREII